MYKWLWLSALVVIADQLSKTWVDYSFYLGESWVLTDFFNITLVYNPGAAFGFLSDQDGWQRWFFLGLSTLIIGLLLRWLRTLCAHEWLVAVALVLILGGAIGNLIDRAIYGHVIDFLDVHWNNWHWPAFNIADSAITVGAFFMLASIFYEGKEKEGA
jgi:signal peptidase II